MGDPCSLNIASKPKILIKSYDQINYKQNYIPGMTTTHIAVKTYNQDDTHNPGKGYQRKV